MKLPLRQRPPDELPGLRAPLRVERRAQSLLRRLRPGDIAVIDQVDLDRDTAIALVESGVVAVVNAAPMLSGRYPALGPQVLTEAGIAVVDTVGVDSTRLLEDGAAARLEDGQLFVGERSVALGRVVDAELVAAEMEQAREGMAAHLDTFTRNGMEFVRREQDLLVHGLGLPTLRTRMVRRPVVVVAKGPQSATELAGVDRFIREQDPVLIGVGRGADVLRDAGRPAHVVVLDQHTDEAELPAMKALRAAKDVVVRVEPGGARLAHERWERLGLRPAFCECGAAPEDVALLLAQRGGASVTVATAMPATLEEFLDRRRSGLAGSYLTRLKVGATLVDARSVPVLYSGRVRPVHLFWVLLAGLLAVLAAVAVTPVGRQWASDLLPQLRTVLDDLQGRFS